MSDLKPCPFCGKPAHFMQIVGMEISGPETWHVGCGTRKCLMEYGSMRVHDKDMAAEIWNRRAEVGPLERPGEGLEPLDTPWMVQDFKDLNTLHPFGDPVHDAVIRIFMWCKRMEEKPKVEPLGKTLGGAGGV